MGKKEAAVLILTTYFFLTTPGEFTRFQTLALLLTDLFVSSLLVVFVVAVYREWRKKND